MTRYIAFLRAINVGGRTVKMDRLRALFQELGYSNVETFIASGNVIFESANEDSHALEHQIETHLQESLGWPVDTFIRSASDVETIAAYQPFGASEPVDGSTIYISFLPAHLSTEQQEALPPFLGIVDDIHVNDREIYLLFRKKISESGFSGAALEKAVGVASTMRNRNTLQRLAKKYPVLK